MPRYDGTGYPRGALEDVSASRRRLLPTSPPVSLQPRDVQPAPSPAATSTPAPTALHPFRTVGIQQGGMLAMSAQAWGYDPATFVPQTGWVPVYDQGQMIGYKDPNWNGNLQDPAATVQHVALFGKMPVQSAPSVLAKVAADVYGTEVLGTNNSLADIGTLGGRTTDVANNVIDAADPLIAESMRPFVENSLSAMSVSGSPGAVSSTDYERAGGGDVGGQAAVDAGFQHGTNLVLGMSGAALAEGLTAPAGVAAAGTDAAAEQAAIESLYYGDIGLTPATTAAAQAIGTSAGAGLGTLGETAQQLGESAAVGEGVNAASGSGSSDPTVYTAEDGTTYQDYNVGTGTPATGYQPTTGLGNFVDDPWGSVQQYLNGAGVSWDQFISNPDAYLGDMASKYGSSVLDFFHGGGAGGTGGGGGGGSGGMGSWLPLLGTGIALGSALTGNYGESDTLPSWYKPYAEDILAKAQGQSNKPFVPYTGDLIAGLDPNEQKAYELASTTADRYMTPDQPDYTGEAAGYIRRSGATLPETDIRGMYMNPYISGVLDPAAREVDTRYALANRDVTDKAAMRDAFGGSRTALLQGELARNQGQNIGDLYSKGYAQAYDTGVHNWQADMTNLRQTGGALADLGTQYGNERNSALAGLTATGGAARGIEQAKLGTGYEQFLREQNFPQQQISDYTNTVAAVRSGNKLEPKDRTTDIIGALTAGAGLYGALNH